MWLVWREVAADNAYNNPEYRKVLESLHGWQRRAWLDGDWDIAAGQSFTTFRRDVHLVADFDESRAREWFAALDYGFTHYTVVLAHKNVIHVETVERHIVMNLKTHRHRPVEFLSNELFSIEA